MDPKIYQINANIERRHWWFRGRQKIVAISLQKTLFQLDKQIVAKKARVLDVGCGTGGQMPFLTKYGTVQGIDSSGDAVAYCLKRGLNVKKAKAENLPFSENSFDFVFALDLLEHVNDRKCLTEIMRVLKPTGIFIFTVPAFPLLWSKHDTLHHHKRRYTKKSLRALLIPLGFSIKKLSYFNTLLLPVVFTIRKVPLLQSLISPEKALEIPPPVVNKVLFSILSLESALLHWTNLPFGVSIIGIAQKTRA